MANIRPGFIAHLQIQTALSKNHRGRVRTEYRKVRIK